MSDAIYERYKDVLRRGHLAALRGRLEDALEAYREAIEIAPDRPLPRASLGSVMLRLARPAEALDAFDAALDRASEDESALAGRAEALTALGRRDEAAETLDRLAGVQAAGGRTAEAAETLRLGLGLAESAGRRRRLDELTGRVLEGPANAASDAASDNAVPASAAVEPPPDGPVEPPADIPAEPQPDPVMLLEEAERRLDAGDAAGARDALLAASAAHRAAGRIDAALDACYAALSVAPADGELHVALADLYLDRGWRGLGAEKLALLARLVELGDDPGAQARIASLVAERVADDPRFSSLAG